MSGPSGSLADHVCLAAIAEAPTHVPLDRAPGRSGGRHPPRWRASLDPGGNVCRTRRRSRLAERTRRARPGPAHRVPPQAATPHTLRSRPGPTRRAPTRPAEAGARRTDVRVARRPRRVVATGVGDRRTTLSRPNRRAHRLARMIIHRSPLADVDIPDL